MPRDCGSTGRERTTTTVVGEGEGECEGGDGGTFMARPSCGTTLYVYVQAHWCGFHYVYPLSPLSYYMNAPHVCSSLAFFVFVRLIDPLLPRRHAPASGAWSRPLLPPFPPFSFLSFLSLLPVSCRQERSPPPPHLRASSPEPQRAVGGGRKRRMEGCA